MRCRPTPRLAKRQTNVTIQAPPSTLAEENCAADHLFWLGPNPKKQRLTVAHPSDSPRTVDPLELDQEALADLDFLIDQSIAEDLRGRVDCTSLALFDKSFGGSATFVTRRAGRICGISVLRRIVEKVSPRLQLATQVEDGAVVSARAALAQLSGDAREILLVERTCLNFLGRLCGIATLTAEYVALISGTNARLYDTRKTTPGWRRLEKFAVRCGGGHNHRLGLHDAILIKDNHLAMLRNLVGAEVNVVEFAVRKAQDWVRQNFAKLPAGIGTIIQIEVDRLSQLEQALRAGPAIILLDNMPPEMMRQAVALRDRFAPEIELEASGGITRETITAVAETGIDRISVGAITHSATNFDIGLDWNDW
jgi:nicotinate-nucleotide pyrophosphorylase (carboxylating)